MQIGWTALHYACAEGRIDTVAKLLKGGASIDKKDMVRLTIYVTDVVYTSCGGSCVYVLLIQCMIVYVPYMF